jgi:multiple sugar transport system permease protein
MSEMTAGARSQQAGTAVVDKPGIQRNEHLKFITPAMVTLAAITIVPTVYGIWLSFHRLPRGGVGKAKFIGLVNYINLFKGVLFWDALKVTCAYVFFSVLISLILGFIIASLLNRRIYGKQIILGFFILPVVATPVVSGLVWKFMFNSDLGIINYFLGLFGIPQINWLASSSTALIAIIIVDLWQWTPFCTFFLLAGLQNLPQETYEAAFIDGANKAQIFWYVTFPQMIPITAVVILFRIMDSFKAFDTIFVMTQGGPGRATQVLNLLAYYTGFRYFNIGKAAALGLLVLVLIVVVSKLILWALRTE